MFIETGRLRIREFTAEDAAAVHQYASNAEVARQMMWGPNTEEETVAFIKRGLTMQKQQPRMDYELSNGRKRANLSAAGRIQGAFSKS